MVLFSLAGAFSSYNGVSRNRIARVLPDASLDLSFNPRTGANGTIHAIALQPGPESSRGR